MTVKDVKFSFFAPWREFEKVRCLGKILNFPQELERRLSRKLSGDKAFCGIFPNKDSYDW